MNERLEALIAENRHQAITSGCCGTPEWRGRLCQYHDGVEDGIYMAVGNPSPPEGEAR